MSRRDRAVGIERYAEIAARHVGDEMAVLDGYRLVQVQPLLQDLHSARRSRWGPSAMRAGSPGMTRAMTKISMDTPIRTMIDVTSRFARRRRTGDMATCSFEKEAAACATASRVGRDLFGGHLHQAEGEAHAIQPESMVRRGQGRYVHPIACREDRTGDHSP